MRFGRYDEKIVCTALDYLGGEIFRRSIANQDDRYTGGVSKELRDWIEAVEAGHISITEDDVR